MTPEEKLAALRARVQGHIDRGRELWGADAEPDGFLRDLLAVLDAPSSPVPPTPDPDALASARRRIGVLYMAGSGGEAAALDLRLAIDEIDAALARPGSGVWISPEEALLAAYALRSLKGWPKYVSSDEVVTYFEKLRDLAARLEQETRA